MQTEPLTQKPIGVFDSGVGGLTVYKALREALPHENFIYLGDTARLPYGTKSSETVAAYALQAARWLMTCDIKMLVVACNTASAQGFTQLQKFLPQLPCVDVIRPGAEASAAASKSGRIAVMATEGTIRSGAYVAAIKEYRPDADVETVACNLMVALAEEGWTEGVEAEAIISRFLKELSSDYDTLVLGCTHFPLLSATIRKLVGNKVRVIDSAITTAHAVKTRLTDSRMLNTTHSEPSNTFYVTDATERFMRLAHSFLGKAVAAETVALSQTTATIDVLDVGKNAASAKISAS